MILKKLEKRLNKKSQIGRMAQRHPFDDIKTLANRISLLEPVIYDGGAAVGSTIKVLRSHFPKSKIIAIEPNPNFHEELKNNSDKLVQVIQSAIGNQDLKIRFNVNMTPQTSSILEPNIVRKYCQEKVALDKKILVDCFTINKIVNSNLAPAPDILKLDLQGYELPALKGTSDVLKGIKIIYSEVEFVSLYKNQCLFHDLSFYLTENNFKLFNLYNLFTHPDGQLTSGDAIWINNRFFK